MVTIGNSALSLINRHFQDLIHAKSQKSLFFKLKNTKMLEIKIEHFANDRKTSYQTISNDLSNDFK